MKKWILLTPLILIVCCKSNVEITYFTPEKAETYFTLIEEICNNERGDLWGKNLYGPLMFIDRTSRKITANQADDDGLLKPRGNVYTGLYPRELIISNTPVTFGSTPFAPAPLPAEDDEYRIVTRALHSLFHRYQLESWPGLVTSYNTANMDEKQARLWLKLEWKALRKAINSEGEEQLLAIRDALIFRGSNRETYQSYAEDQNRFECYEGLATFTYTFLMSQTFDELKARLFESLDRIYFFQSYSRSYGFIHGALYATLLSQKGFDFTTIRTEKTDLGVLVKEMYGIVLPLVCRDIAGSIAINYNIEDIYREEEERLRNIKESLNKQVAVFTEKPVVFFELESPYFDFEPEDVHTLDTLGTLYSRLRVSDNWGKLTVDKVGCLVSNNYKYLRINAKGLKIERNHIYGEGWNLVMNSNWEIIEVNQNYFVRKLSP